MSGTFAGTLGGGAASLARYFDVEDYLAVSGAESTSAVQRAFDAALLAGGTVLYPHPPYLVSDTLRIESPTGSGLCFMSMIGQGLAPALWWNGPDEMPVIWSKGWNGSTIDKVAIYDGGKDGVVCWEIDDPAPFGSSSRLSFRNSGASLLGEGGVGVRGGQTGESDVSMMNFDNFAVMSDDNAKGNIGFQMIHANVLGWQWHGGFAANLNTVFRSARGSSATFFGFHGSHNLLEFHPDQAGNLGVFGGRFEVGHRFLETGIYDGGNLGYMPITLTGVEIAGAHPADGTLFLIGIPAQLSLDTVDIVGTEEWTDAMVKLGGDSTGYGSFAMRNGAVQTADDPFYTVGHGNWAVRIEDVGKIAADGSVIGRYTNRVSA